MADKSQDANNLFRSGAPKGNEVIVVWRDNQPYKLAIADLPAYLAYAGFPIGFAAWKTMAADYSAVNGDRVLVDTRLAPVTITLPPIADGASCWLQDYADTWQTNNCIINAGASLIGGQPSPMLANVKGAQIQLIYRNGSWRF